MDQPATVIGVFAPLSRGSSSTIAPQSLPGDFGGTKQGGYSEAVPEGYQQGFQQCSAHLKGLANLATNVSRFGMRDRRSIKADWRQWRLM